jgi:hypothetical protein
MSQTVEIVAALLVLGAFAGAQAGWLQTRSRTYLLFNLVGTGVLAAIAWRDRSWGFVLLEGVWALVSAVSLIVVLSRRSERTDGSRKGSSAGV